MRSAAGERASAVWLEFALPVRPPFPPMEAKLVAALPPGDQWQFEPKWDGFRCLAFREGQTIALQSKSGQPLARYFPEIVIPAGGGFSFDDLLLRIHPSASRIRKLAGESPGILLVFDLLVDAAGRSLLPRPLTERRPRLEAFVRQSAPSDSAVRLCPATTDREIAQDWYADPAGLGLDGVIAKRLDVPYASGERTGMQKIKRMRTADCVVGGFRYAARGNVVGSLLLGLYGDGLLHHVGFSSSFNAAERKALTQKLEPLVKPPGFTGNAPGGPSRWSSERTGEWKPLEPVLVCEVRYDHWSGGRFRHGSQFLRWRPDKAPRQCTLEQVE